jgi:hypothetical protein
MCLDQRLKFLHEFGARSEPELRVDEVFERGRAELGESSDLVCCERFECEVGERFPTPERERLAQPLDALLPLGFAATRGQALEPIEIDLFRPDVEQVAAWV